MKLHEIAKQKPLVVEGQVEPNVMLSIRNIISRGKADNTFEFMMVARLLQLLKDGNFYKNSNPFDSNMPTSKAVLDHLRSLPPEQMKKIAENLWTALQLMDNESLTTYCNPGQDYVEWLKLFTSREAND